MGQGVRDGQWYGRPKGLDLTSSSILIIFFLLLGWTWGIFPAGAIGGSKGITIWLIGYPIVVISIIAMNNSSKKNK